MTQSAIPISVALIGVLATACYPVQEHPPRRPRAMANPNPPAVTYNAPAQPADVIPYTPPKTTEPARAEKPVAPRETAAQKPAAQAPAAEKAPDEKPSGTLTAKKAPGREGYVLSPYSGKLMLISGIPSGTIVPDQTCPPAEKKFFRVP